jgi:POT family proton-dependent oligopeptide transporter
MEEERQSEQQQEVQQQEQYQLQEKIEPSSKLSLLEKPHDNASDTDLTEDNPNDVLPTDEDWKTLREVADSLPLSAYLVILIEFCERFTFYGLSGPFQNYVQAPDPGSCKFKWS